MAAVLRAIVAWVEGMIRSEFIQKRVAKNNLKVQGHITYHWVTATIIHLDKHRECGACFCHSDVDDATVVHVMLYAGLASPEGVLFLSTITSAAGVASGTRILALPSDSPTAHHLYEPLI